MSTSANAGKVMLGADGCPLRGHDGKIVLADNIYPSFLANPFGSYSYWRRYANDDTDYTADSIWSTNWSSGYVRPRRFYWPGSGYASTAAQLVCKIPLTWIGLSGDDIPWTRVKTAMQLDWEFVTSAHSTIAPADWLNPESLAMRVYYSFATQSDPAGHEEMWERANWVQLGAAYGDDTKSGRLTLTQTPPDVLWLAFVCDPIGGTPALYDEYGYDQSIDSYSINDVSRNIVYNLAT